MKKITLTLLLAMICLAVSLPVQAASYPNKEIRLIVPPGPGGAVDVMARAIQRYLPEVIGVQVLVENRTGAGGKIGVQHFLRQKPDGYTLLVFHQPGITDISKEDSNIKLEDMAIINIQWSDPALLYAHKDMGWKNLDDMLAAAAKEPDKYVIARPIASAAESQMIEQIVKDLKWPVKILPLDSGGAARVAVRGKHAQMGTGGAQSLTGENDIIVGLAYYSDKESKDWPGVPTMNSQLAKYGYQIPAVVGPQRLIAVQREFKEKDPEGFKKLVEAFRVLTTEHQGFIDYCNTQNIGHDWVGPEESEKQAWQTHETFMKMGVPAQ